MSTLSLSALQFTFLITIVPVACSGPARGQIDPPDATVPTPPQLTLERIAVVPYLGPSRVLVTVRARAGSEPLALRRESLELITRDGTRAAALDLDAPLACAAAELAPGLERRCHFAFRIPASDAPASLRHADSGVVIRIEGCGAAPRAGLCPTGELCADGGCTALCDGPAGGSACFLDEEVCSPGGCVLPCSALAPEGYCPSGRCDSGTCVP